MDRCFLERTYCFRGCLPVSFEVVHVDSHTDLGLVTDSATFISKQLLQWPVAERPSHSTHINCYDREFAEGIEDYLLFAIAYRWINKLIYCGNPNVEVNDYDVHALKDFEENSIFDDPVENTIQLPCYPSKDCPQPYNRWCKLRWGILTISCFINVQNILPLRRILSSIFLKSIFSH